MYKIEHFKIKRQVAEYYVKHYYVKNIFSVCVCVYPCTCVLGYEWEKGLEGYIPHCYSSWLEIWEGWATGRKLLHFMLHMAILFDFLKLFFKCLERRMLLTLKSPTDGIDEEIKPKL